MAHVPDNPALAQVWVDNTDPLNPQFEFYIPRGSKGDPGGLVNPSAISVGYDWNNLIVSGLYYAAGADLGGQPNSPPSYAIGVNVMVQARSAAVVTQIAWTVNNSHSQIQFMRSLVSGTWGPWKVFRNTAIDNSAGRVLTIWDETNNRSQFLYGDTGQRDISADAAWLAALYVTGSVDTAAYCTLRRVGYTVELAIGFSKNVTGVVSPSTGFPVGFRPTQRVHGIGSNSAQSLVRFYNGGGGSIPIWNSPATSSNAMLTLTYTTNDPWPTTLPGVAIGTIPNT